MKAHPLDDADTRRRYWKLKMIKEDGNVVLFKKKLTAYLKRQEEKVVDSLAEGKIFKKDLIDETFNLEIEAKIAEEELKPLLHEFADKSGAEAMEFAGSNYQFSLSSEIVSNLDKRAELFALSINKTTFEKLKSELRISIEQGESRQEMVSRIRETYGDISKGRANTIARTETGSAMTTGTFEGYKQAKVESKVWTAVMDGSTRDSHAWLDGEKVPLNQPFSNGLAYPRDPRGRASEVVNCRCVL